jgi:hypothetical protein
MTTTNPVKNNPVVKLGANRIHTLHLNNKDIFTIQKNGTSVLSFRNKVDAIRFGKILESHYDLTKEWPVVEFEDTVLYRHSSKLNRLKYLSTKNWHEDDLRDFCIINCFGMLDIVKFADDDLRLIGHAIQWDTPMHFYVDSLTEKFNQE